MPSTTLFVSFVPVILCAVAVLFQYISFDKPDASSVEKFFTNQQSGGHIWSIAHRGAAHDAPENTIGALQHCIKSGVYAIEVDVGITRDGVLVLMHDDSLDRTTNGSGLLSALAYGELQTFNAAAHHPRGGEFGFQPIPSLRQVVKFAYGNRMKLFLDIKANARKLGYQEDQTATDGTQVIEKLAQLYRELPYLGEMSIICSFDPWLVYKARSSIPSILVGLTHQHQVNQYTSDGVRKIDNPVFHHIAFVKDMMLEWSQTNWLWRVVGNSVYIIHKGDVSPNFVKLWLQREIRVIAWTVNSNSEKEYLTYLGVPYMTDKLIADASSTS